jgi:hypothetical protein
LILNSATPGTNATIVEERRTHTCTPDAIEIGKRQVTSVAVQIARTNPELPVGRAVAQSVQGKSKAVLATVKVTYNFSLDINFYFKLDQVSRRVRRNRKKGSDDPPVPSTIEFEISHAVSALDDGSSFVLYDSHLDSSSPLNR